MLHKVHSAVRILRGRASFRAEGEIGVQAAHTAMTGDTKDIEKKLHGGYMNEYRVACVWRDARVAKMWVASNLIMKELVGRDLGL